MENFFDWMVKIIPKDEVEVWFNIHNMHYEKIELFGDVFISLHHLIKDTYLGEDTKDTKIFMSEDDNKKHFEWCWKKTIERFQKENIVIEFYGEHKDYIESFFIDTFYSPITENVKNTLNLFLKQTFRLDGVFSKSDLEILTEIYKLLDKSIK